MGWVQTEVRFPGRVIIFTISKQDAVNNGFDAEALERLATDPDISSLEFFARLTVLKVRPELTNCEIVYMNFSFPHQLWEIGVGHPSLPAVASGCEIVREPLFPAPAVPNGE